MLVAVDHLERLENLHDTQASDDSALPGLPVFEQLLGLRNLKDLSTHPGIYPDLPFVIPATWIYHSWWPYRRQRFGLAFWTVTREVRTHVVPGYTSGLSLGDTWNCG